MTSSDEVLISRVLNDDHEAMARLVDRYKDGVFGLCLRLVKNKESAEELTQDVFVKMYKALANFKTESKFSTWLYRIAYNHCMSHFRTQKSATSSLQDSAHLTTINEGAERLDLEDQRRLIKQLLHQLPQDERVILQLFYLEEQSIKEICAITGFGLSNVKVKLHRAKNKLRNQFSDKTQSQTPSNLLNLSS